MELIKRFLTIAEDCLQKKSWCCSFEKILPSDFGGWKIDLDKYNIFLVGWKINLNETSFRTIMTISGGEIYPVVLLRWDRKKTVFALSKEKGKVMFGSFLSFPGFPIGFPRALQDIGHKAGSKSGALPGGFQKWTTPNLGNQISSWRRNQNCCQKEISWLVQNFDIEFVLCDDGWRKEIRQQGVINSGAVMNEFWLILPSQDFHT